MSAIKLGFLAIRTIAKPVANSIKSYSAKHPKFRDACIRVAQFSHKTEMQLKMKFLGYKVESIRPLNDARAVEVGANFLGEAIIFGVAGSLIILENARWVLGLLLSLIVSLFVADELIDDLSRTRMNARDRKNYVNETLDSLMLITEELREELKELSVSSEKWIEELQRENRVLKKTLSEILDVSLRLRNHNPYTGQEIGIGDTTGGFVLQVEPRVQTFSVDPSPSQSSSSETYAVQTAANRSGELSKSAPQSSYDYHHQHHQLGHPQPEDNAVLIEQQGPLPSQHVKRSRWESVSLPWSSSGSSGSSSSPTA
ncbi:hypothetical protein BGZ65_000353 [Modicella reniformis]|uniref:Uncharacterized protein n=1 Tax=Modicella reniformis TaxID=1440133 RepID=A0A9P6J4R6_9FUNG|nr:hypothetical protein BGZ65_000353 [Modicella reniformis]